MSDHYRNNLRSLWFAETAKHLFKKPGFSSLSSECRCEGCGSPIFCLTLGEWARGRKRRRRRREEEEEAEEAEEAEDEAAEAADLPGRCGYIHPTMATSENKTAGLAACHVG